MKFKASYSFHKLSANEDGNFPQNIKLSDEAEIVIWRRFREIDGGKKRDLCFDVILDLDISRTLFHILKELKNNRIVLDPTPQIDLNDPFISSEIDKNGKIKENHIVSFEYMPKSYREFHRNLSKKFEGIARNLIGALRWRQRSSGTHRSYASDGMGYKFSLDGENWKYLPSEHQISMMTPRGIEFKDQNIADAMELFSNNISEPFYHELLREARGVEHASNRSTLLIAIAALETGVKSYLNYVLPDAEFLMDRIPSPPILVILQEVIPSIHKRRGVSFGYFPLSQDEKNFLQARIFERNKISHGANVNVDIKNIDNLIIIISKILYSIDYLMGNAWAAKFINLDNFEERQHIR